MARDTIGHRYVFDCSTPARELVPAAVELDADELAERAARETAIAPTTPATAIEDRIADAAAAAVAAVLPIAAPTSTAAQRQAAHDAARTAAREAADTTTEGGTP